MLNDNRDTMAAHYLICGSIAFYPESYILSSISEKRSVTLFAPAAKFLQLLLERKGEVIPQREIISYAWPEEGYTVTPNNYYQHISYLRRALAEFLPDEDIIRTVKRVGLVISDETETEFVFENTQEQSKLSAAEVPFSPLTLTSPDSESDDKQSLPEATTSTGKTPNFLSQKMTKKSLLIFLVSTVLLLALFFSTRLDYLTSNDKVYEDPFKNYIKLNENKECSIFINPGYGPANYNMQKSRITEEQCKNYNYIYITIYEETVNSSIVYCNKNGTTFLSCVSTMFTRNRL